ncbi:MAG TPA: VOC family protein [Stellaceae bacterium]|nr:VOC family protein [Stellaceae bacterium]
MAGKAKHVPAGFHTATPCLAINGAARAIDFYKKAFGATEVMRFAHGDKVGHAEIQIGDSKIMISDEFPDMGVRGPKTVGGSATAIYLYVDNVDAVADRAQTEGAKMVRPVEDKFYGDRSGTFEDPFGHIWHLATHKEDLSEEELKKRAEAFMKQQGSKK